MAKKLTSADVDEWLKINDLSSEYELISTKYENAITPLKFKHLKCGTVFDKSFNHLKRFQLCPNKECVDERKRMTCIEKYGVDNPMKTEKVREKMKKTCIEKYGAPSPLESNEIQEKIKNTNLKKYGVDNPFKSNKIRKKINNTMNEKYGGFTYTSKELSRKAKKTLKENHGVETPFDSEKIRNKAKKTFIEKYGVDNPLKSPVIRKKIKKTHLSKYNSETPFESKDFRDKCIKIIEEKYGVNNVFGSKEFQEKIKNNYMKEYGVEYPSQIKYSDRIKNILFNKESFKDFISDKTIYDIVSDEEELSFSTVYYFAERYDLITDEFYSKNESYGRSRYEFEIQKWLMDETGHVFEPNRDILVNPITKRFMEIDLYCDELKFGIEFNGVYWHSTIFLDKKTHQNKSMIAEENGIFIYHIFEHDWLNPVKREIIKSQLLNRCGKTPERIFARKCEIREVDFKTTRDFMNENHLQGDGNLNKQINYGLYHNGELVYMMTFGKWRRGFKGIIDWELFRSCSKIFTTVVGGAERLFKHFLKNHPEGTIGTYSSIQSGTGMLYDRLGFQFERVTQPSSVKVDSQNKIHTMFSKDFKETIGLEIYGCGNKLWTLKR